MAGGTVEPLAVNINGANLRNVHSFCYLGSTFNSSGNIKEEVQRMIGLAAASFANYLQGFSGAGTSLFPQSFKVYKAVCISILYCSETWVPYRRHIKNFTQDANKKY